MSSLFFFSRKPKQQEIQATYLQYITFDSIHEGVGASQVLAYLNRLSKEFKIKLINFEKETQPTNHILNSASIFWNPIPFGKPGVLSGVGRIIRLIRYIDRNLATHARGDFACFAALLKGNRRVIWDCRALTPDQRYEIARKSKVSLGYFALRLIEAICAKRSEHVIVITDKAKQELVKRYRLNNAKLSVISTCVDLEVFRNSPPLNSKEEIRILLSGTIGPQYNLHLLAKLVEELKKQRKVRVGVAASRGKYHWQYPFAIDEYIEVAQLAMPEVISRYHVGFSSWHSDLGVSLKSVAATKNAEFLACGRPIITNFNQGDIGGEVTKWRIGIATYNDTEEEISEYAKELLSLIDDPKLGSRCREYAERNFSLTDATKRIAAIYNSLD